MRLLQFCVCVFISAFITIAISVRAAHAQAGDACAFGDVAPGPPLHERVFVDANGRLMHETFFLGGGGIHCACELHQIGWGQSAAMAARNDRPMTSPFYRALEAATGPLHWITAMMGAALYATWLYYGNIKTIQFAALLSGSCVRQSSAAISQARFNTLLAQAVVLTIYGLMIASALL
jgi:hypothetical protein